MGLRSLWEAITVKQAKKYVITCSPQQHLASLTTEISEFKPDPKRYKRPLTDWKKQVFCENSLYAKCPHLPFSLYSSTAISYLSGDVTNSGAAACMLRECVSVCVGVFVLHVLASMCVSPAVS